MTTDGPFCPECAEPVGADTEYCMHCYQNFDGDVSPVDTKPDVGSPEAPDSGEGYGEWDGEEGSADVPDASSGYEDWETGAGEVLDPEGIVDNTLTVIVGIVAGLIIGMISIFVLLALTESPWGFLFGFVVWLGTTAHLVRRYTVQEAVSHAGYALAVVLIAIPLLAAVLGGGSIEDRLSDLFFSLMFVTIPAAISGTIGWIASQFVPEQKSRA